MSDKLKIYRPRLSAKGKKAFEERQERLASMLRSNLRKRKLQKRSRSSNKGSSNSCL